MPLFGSFPKKSSTVAVWFALGRPGPHSGPHVVRFRVPFWKFMDPFWFHLKVNFALCLDYFSSLRSLVGSRVASRILPFPNYGTCSASKILNSLTGRDKQTPYICIQTTVCGPIPRPRFIRRLQARQETSSPLARKQKASKGPVAPCTVALSQ